MNQPKFILAIALAVSAVLTGATGVFAQKVDPSYDVSLQVIVGSNDSSQRGEIPSNLAAISKELRTNFTFSNYRLTSTFMGRISEAGNFEFKSISNVLGQESPAGAQTFLEWSLINLRNAPNEKNLQATAFRFGARVPVVTGSFKDENVKANPVINYEPIGITLSKVGFSENVPTLMGTLSLPGTNGTAFLVVTIRSAVQ